jgi:hypothetical protein
LRNFPNTSTKKICLSIQKSIVATWLRDLGWPYLFYKNKGFILISIYLKKLLESKNVSNPGGQWLNECALSSWQTLIHNILNIYLTKSGQNAGFWTFCDHNEGIGWSRRATKILKREKTINFIFLQKHEKSQKPKNKLYLGGYILICQDQAFISRLWFVHK